MSSRATELSSLMQRLSQVSAPSTRGDADRRRGRAQRKRAGAFFTPGPLVEFMVWSLFAGQGKLGSEMPRIRVLDPSAGDGRFLAEAERWLCENWAARRGTVISEGERRALREQCLFAIERDPVFAKAIEEAMPGVRVRCEDALLDEGHEGAFDVVIGNPPYLRANQLRKSEPELLEALRGRFVSTSNGEWDLSLAFLEKAREWMSEAGQLAFVLPSRWWTASWAAPLRHVITPYLSELVDFGDRQLFAGATVYSSLCFAQAQPSGDFSLWRECSGQWQESEVGIDELDERGFLAGISAGHWHRRDALRLGEVARIAKGTGTNADSVFVLDANSEEVEEELCRPVYRGRDVVWNGKKSSAPSKKLLFPYEENNQLIEPETMRDRYPRAYRYLLKHRDKLESREKGRFRGERFYCFGRPQNHEYLADEAPKVIVPDVCQGGRALIDCEGAMVLDSAYAIRSTQEHVSSEFLCAILNSGIVRAWLAKRGVPLRGGYTRMKTAYLRDLPLPNDKTLIASVEDSVRAGASAEAIDAKVRAAYQVESW